MDSDVIVLGGGPAGAISAWLAARDGLRVLLVDPDRQKPRIEGLAPRLRQWLAAEGLLEGFDGLAGPLPRRVDWAGLAEANAEYVVFRPALDRHLRAASQRAGAVLVPGSGRPEPGGVLLADGRRLAAPLVIDARGRRVTGADRAPATLAISGWLGVVPGAALAPGIRLAALPDGWLWRVALPNGRVWAQLMLDAAGPGSPETRLRAALALAEPDLAAAPLPGGLALREAAPHGPAPLGALSVIAVGDALAAMDPLSGHGQFWAVSSALAAAAVRRTLAVRPGSADLCRRFLAQRALGTSIDQMRKGRDFIRAEDRFRDRPFWARRRDFPDDLPLAPPPAAPAVQRRCVVEDGLVAERAVLCTPRSPGGIGWFGRLPAPDVWAIWRQGGQAALSARWGPGAAAALARRLAEETAPA